MNKKILLPIYHVLLSLYMIICTSFFYKQYCEVVNGNISNVSNLVYFIKDNLLLVVLFSLVLISVLFNLFYVSEYWIFTSKETLKIKRILGYTYAEILKSFTLEYMVHLISAYLLSEILSIPFLKYFRLPIGTPIIIAGVSMTGVIGIIIILLFWRNLNAYRKNRHVGINIAKKMALTFQFSLSLMLLFVSLTLFQDLNRQLSPYKNYMNLDSAWVIQANYPGEIEKRIEIERNPDQFRGGVLKKIESIFTQYKQNILVFFQSPHYSNTLGNIVFLDDNALKLNNIDIEVFKSYKDMDAIPLITSNTQHFEGDRIATEECEYIVAKVVDKPFTVLGPSDFTELSSKEYYFAYFDHSNLNRFLELSNTNFIDNLYLINISHHEIETINDFINEPMFKYTTNSIKGIQTEYYNQKMITLASYFGVGIINLLFSIFGLICALFVDINRRALDFALHQVVGYSKRELINDYLQSLLWIMSISIGLTVAITHITLDLKISVLGIGIILVGLVVLLLRRIITKTVEAINILNIIGGENV